MYVQQTVNGHLPSVLRAFALSLGFAFIGTMAGVFVPPALFLPLVILEVVMLLFAFFIRRKKFMSYTFLYSFTFISGITTYPIVSHYLSDNWTQPGIVGIGNNNGCIWWTRHIRINNQT